VRKKWSQKRYCVRFVLQPTRIENPCCISTHSTRSVTISTATRVIQEQEQYGYGYEARVTRTTKKEGCISGRRKASSVLAGGRSKRRASRSKKPHQHEIASRQWIESPPVSSEEASIDAVASTREEEY